MTMRKEEAMNKPTFLRNLKIRKVDLVDQGANQHAHIRLAKRNDETSETTEATGEEKAFFARIGDRKSVV